MDYWLPIGSVSQHPFTTVVLATSLPSYCSYGHFADPDCLAGHSPVYQAKDERSKWPGDKNADSNQTGLCFVYHFGDNNFAMSPGHS